MGPMSGEELQGLIAGFGNLSADLMQKVRAAYPTSK
jgi:hypothetical protein